MRMVWVVDFENVFGGMVVLEIKGLLILVLHLEL